MDLLLLFWRARILVDLHQLQRLIEVGEQLNEFIQIIQISDLFVLLYSLDQFDHLLILQSLYYQYNLLP